MERSRRWFSINRSSVAAILAVFFLALVPIATHHPAASYPPMGPSLKERSRVMTNFARLPLAFEQNRGQVQGDTNFIARGSGFEAFLDPAGATVALGAPQLQTTAPTRHQPVVKPSRPELSEIRMNLEGASHATRPEAEDRLPGVVNYYRGSDRSKWHRDVPTYARVRYAEVYRGIDLAYYGDRGTFEFDFALKPGADAKNIAL